MGHYVYKYVLNGEVIYIGKNDTELESRLICHGTKSDNIPEVYRDEINNSDIYYARLPNRTMSDVVESELIRRYKPKCNSDNDYKKATDWDGLPFEEPKWIKYDKAMLKRKRGPGEKTPCNRFSEEEYKRLQAAVKIKEFTFAELTSLLSGAVFQINDRFIWVYHDKLNEERAKEFVEIWDLATKNTKNTFVEFVTNKDLSKVIPLHFKHKSDSEFGIRIIGTQEYSTKDPESVTCYLPRINYVVDYLSDPSGENYKLIKRAECDCSKVFEEKRDAYIRAENSKLGIDFTNVFVRCLLVIGTGHSLILVYDGGQVKEIEWVPKAYKEDNPDAYWAPEIRLINEKYSSLFAQQIDEMGIPYIGIDRLLVKKYSDQYSGESEYRYNGFSISEFLYCPYQDNQYAYPQERAKVRENIQEYRNSDRYMDDFLEIDEDKDACTYGVIEQDSKGKWSLGWHNSQKEADKYMRSITSKYEAHAVWDIKDL